jgi:hypothetical protein
MKYSYACNNNIRTESSEEFLGIIHIYGTYCNILVNGTYRSITIVTFVRMCYKNNVL